jgi:PAS domain S-box-containing protein
MVRPNKAKEDKESEILAENESLRQQLAEARETLRAIQHGEVDALIVSTPEGEQVYSITGAEKPYRVLIEEMKEGAVMLSEDNTILYCNIGFAKIIKRSLDTLIGKSIGGMVNSTHLDSFHELLALSRKGEGTKEKDIAFLASNGTWVPTHVSVNSSLKDNFKTAFLVITDLTQHMQQEVKQYTEDLEWEITERKKAEEQMAFQSKLLKAVGDAVIATDAQGKIVFWNDAAWRIYGWASKEVLGRNIADVNVPKISQKDAQRIMEKLSQGQSWSGEFLVQRRDGTTFPAFVTDSPVLNAKRELVGIIGISVDITERKKAEETLRYYDLLVSSTSDAVFSTDNEFIIRSWNKAAEQIFGWTAEEAIGKASTSIFKPVYPTLDGITRKQAVERITEKGFWKGDIIYHKKDGSPIMVSASSSLVKDKNGSAVGMVAIVHDITARKRREEALRETQRDLNHAQAVAKTGSWRLDMQRNVLVWSDENHRIFGVPKGTPMTYEGFLGIVHPDDREYVDRKWKAALRGKPYDIEHRLIVNGKVKWVRERAELEFSKAGTLLAGFGTTQEITKIVKMRKKLENYASNLEKLAEERAMKLRDAERLAAIGATAGMVGHDIRNPLQAITCDVYFAKTELTNTPDSEEKKNALESLEEIEKNIDYINKIVQDLQDYARPLNPKVEESDLRQIAESLFAKNGFPENVEFIVEVSEDTRKIRVDAYYLNRILYNLVTNAVQAMPQGGKLTVASYKQGNDAVITVADTGVGIPKAIQEKMFTLMFTTKSKGQGFGLPVVKRMTESLGGTVTFESEEGKGTKFTVRLPPPKELNGKLIYK